MNDYDRMCADSDGPTWPNPAVDCALRWEVTYVPQEFTIKPTFVTDRKAWPL